MAGLTLGARFAPPPGGLGPAIALAAAAVAIAVGAAFANRPAWWGVGITIGMISAGFAFLHYREPTFHDWETRPPREITVTIEIDHAFAASPQARSLSGLGTVVAAPDDSPQLAGRRLYYSAIRRISVPAQRSGRYQAQGVLESLPRSGPSPGFNDYLANLGIRQRLVRARLISEEAPPRWLPRFYAAAEKRLESILRRGLASHPDIASLYLGMLLGEKAVLSAEQQQAFLSSGTFHIFSISGLHVGLIAGALSKLMRGLRLSRRCEFALTILTLWCYVQITGASSPALRSFLMVAFVSGALVLRVPGTPFAALAAAAWATLLLDPLQLFSSGFQMSYTVVAALVLMGGPLRQSWLAHWKPFAFLPQINWHRGHRVVQTNGAKLIANVAMCWVAFLASTPSAIGYFGLFSTASLLANLVIIPLSGVVITAGFISMLAGLVGLTTVSTWLNLTALTVIEIMTWLLPRGMSIPGAVFPAQFRAAWITPCSMLAVLAVMVAGAAGRWSRDFGGFWLPVIAVLLLLIFGVRFG